jgi:hypothetical protein
LIRDGRHVTTSIWRLEAEVDPSMPALAWVAHVTAGRVRAVCGASVRLTDDALFEGTWAGPSDLPSLVDQTTVFGSGLVLRGDEVAVITPSHHLEGVHSALSTDGSVVVSNSLAGALIGARLELDPNIDYSTLLIADLDRWQLIEDMTASQRPIRGALQAIPTTTGDLTSHFFENAAIDSDLAIRVVRKPRELPFTSFAGFHERILDATRSLFANASGYTPVVSVSGGYDSTAVAVIAAEAGCTRAIGFELSRPARSDGSTADSGAENAARLGMSFKSFDRLAYRMREGTPEAEFLSTGMVGEEVVFAAMEQELNRSTMLTGYWAGREWAMGDRDEYALHTPHTTAGTSLTEFRLRADFLDVPLPVFGAAQPMDAPMLVDLPEMDPFRVGGPGMYDRPIPRRLIEEAGIPRGSFATRKRAVNVALQHNVLADFSAGTQRAVAEFARTEGRQLPTISRPQLSRLERAALRLAGRFPIDRLARGAQRRRNALQHFEPELGNLLFRWAVTEMRPRYAATEKLWQ